MGNKDFKRFQETGKIFRQGQLVSKDALMQAELEVKQAMFAEARKGKTDLTGFQMHLLAQRVIKGAKVYTETPSFVKAVVAKEQANAEGN